MTISNRTLILALGSSGVYLSGHSSGSPTFSAPVTLGTFISPNAAGQPAISAVKGVSDAGSLIMLDFGPADTASTAGAAAAGNGAATTPNTAANATTGILDFTGEGSKYFNLQIMVDVVFVGLAVFFSMTWIETASPDGTDFQMNGPLYGGHLRCKMESDKRINICFTIR